MSRQRYILKNDKYRKKRGGFSRLLSVYCRSCNKFVLKYQKDGPGNLRRLYLDRIVEPANFTNLVNKNIKDLPNLSCPKCHELLGTPMMYRKEQRKSFRLFQDAIAKKISSLYN